VAGYNIKHFSTDQGAGGTSSYLNQAAYAGVHYTPSTTLRLQLEENLQAASGTNPQNYANSSVIINSGFDNTAGFIRRDDTVDDYVRSVTTFNASWIPAPRAAITLTVSEDILTQPGRSTDYMTTMRTTADYSLSDLYFRLRASYTRRLQGGETTDYLESQGLQEYRPNRFFEGALVYTHSMGQIDSENDSEYLDLIQRLKYTFYTFSGVNRKLLELNEEYNYNRTRNSGNAASVTMTANRFTLGARYYPLQSLFVGGNVRFSLLEPGRYWEHMYDGSIGLTFQKLQASIDYSYGRRTGTDNRVEKRLAANLKKFF
jgi:hypothetical protein